MIISAEEAKKLKPVGYKTNDELQQLIIKTATQGLSNIWCDLTLSQVSMLKSLGYSVEQNMYEASYKITWK